MSKRATAWVWGASILFFGAFFVWPIARILAGGFFDADGAFTLDYLREVFADPLYREGFINAFGLAVCATALSALIAVPLAVLMDRFDFFGKKALQIALLTPLMLPPFVGALGMRQLFGVSGAVNQCLLDWGVLNAPVDWLGQGRFAGMAAMLALSLYPVLYLNVLGALANCDPALEEAAANLGCRPWKRFFKITLPLMWPGLFGGGALVFIWAFTELGVPLLFDYPRITAVQVFNGLSEIGRNPVPYALVTALMAASLLLYGAAKIAAGGSRRAMFAKMGPARVPVRLRGIAAWGARAACGGVAFCALTPHLAVVLLSFAGDWYRSALPQTWTLGNYALAFTEGMTIGAVKNSLVYAGGATVAAMCLGVGIGMVVARGRGRSRHALDAMAMAPLAVPGLVLAFGYLSMTGPREVLAFLNPVENPAALLIAAYAVRRLPFMVRAVAAGLEQTSVAYEEAALNLGCRPARTLATITLPLISANLIAGGVLVFSQALLEVSDSLMLAQKQEFYPVTKAIYELANFLGSGPFLASALGVWAMAFLGLTFIGAGLLLGKKLGAMFSIR